MPYHRKMIRRQEWAQSDLMPRTDVLREGSDANDPSPCELNGVCFCGFWEGYESASTRNVPSPATLNWLTQCQRGHKAVETRSRPLLIELALDLAPDLAILEGGGKLPLPVWAIQPQHRGAESECGRHDRQSRLIMEQRG
ncbi:hypothetical protein [Klenkia sp. PcliD-1-E]|uniref:hypothetical protein n=1 Tax=Klenkia sp. PcliD-1-E TaxID=2954492 RepID=UPI002098425E|nr:hypothetical protein [Klenkia sp. PcliD-1-E]MCO7218996.1 hypothetical protein [Klenkia sp. PcliD-1-E]